MFAPKALYPTAVILDPVVLASNAPEPRAELKVPVVFAAKAT